ncbi:T-cell surface glycoprotein CD3 zeta chain [Coregonus clupeaformis]|uniref:T-cell surface glycoprotein CD3 zeta chain n=1 Tax=Coregonus clupeaformis TaxID=59861 RepID=UPI001BE05B99|nr:T-cell surface glycoprotein CD3 zeta chain [Coregonus clupeaformis]
MDPRKRTGGLLVLSTALPYAEAVTPLYDPKLCYILDGFLLLYGLIITGLLLKEKFFKSKGKILKDDEIYTDLKPTGGDGYGRINRRDPESGMTRDKRMNNDDTYTSLKKPTDDTYREIAVKDKQRRRNKNEQVYQGLSTATKDTYDSLQMQPLPPPR